MGLLIGVTGSIGAGKSTVCRMLGHLGRTVLSADLLAREIMESDRTVMSEIRSALGSDLFTREGKPDRAAIGRLVFADSAALARLNAIVHPRVFLELDRRLAALPHTRREPYVAIEAALIFETGMEERLDHVVVVHASEAVRIARVTARDNIADADVRRRMRSQMPAAKKAGLADLLIENETTEEELRGRVEFIDRLLVAMASG
jgi:dephospho-CoA kinase